MLKTNMKSSPVTTTKTKLMGRLRSTKSKVATWICAVFLLLMLSNVGFAQQSTSDYLKKFKPVSVELMQETGIPASVILGIAMLESGTGTSKNAKLLHNHFGIVGKNNLSQTNPGHKSRYKQYLSDVASYEHFVQLLTKKKWYTTLQGNMEYTTWLNKMNHSGYSSAGQEWIKRVTNIINRYKLYKLDAAVGNIASGS